MTEPTTRSGGCLCGAVRFEVAVPEAKFAICHCGMCRKWSAGPFMTVHTRGDQLRFFREEGLAWYQGSAWAQRGFCSLCGTSLFWRQAAHPEQDMAVSSEALDEADDLVLDRHIYVDAQPARYQFAGDEPRVTEAELMAKMGISPDENE